ncbi:MAG: hypothetical protein V4681_02270 [Patescibacteria group bacterium]
MGALAKLGGAILIVIALILYIRTHGGVPKATEVAQAPLLAAAVVAPANLPVAIEGSIVTDDGPSSNSVPYLLYSEEGTRVVTKRLVLTDGYACYAGDIPCTPGSGNPEPLQAGTRVRVEGRIEADVIYVSRLDVLGG